MKKQKPTFKKLASKQKLKSKNNGIQRLENKETVLSGTTGKKFSDKRNAKYNGTKKAEETKTNITTSESIRVQENGSAEQNTITTNHSEEQINKTNDSGGTQSTLSASQITSQTQTTQNPRNAGRHAKDCTCDKCTAKRTQKPVNYNQFLKEMDDIIAFKNAAQQQGDTIKDKPFSSGVNQPTQSTQQQTPQAGTLINGYILLILADTILPIGVSFIIKKQFKRVVPPDEIMLSPEQMTKIEPLADEAAKYISMQVNPMILFIISMGAMYYQNATAYINANPIAQERTKKRK